MTVALTESTGCYTALSKETGEELKLAMQRLWLTGQVTPFGARLLVEHTFESAERRPVEVVYGFMLPQDAALRSFRVTGEGFEVSSDLQPVDKAVSAYEEGIDMGSLSVLARQYADGMMNLTVGNLRPGEPVRVILEIVAGVERHDDGFRFRFPFTLAPAYHRQARVVSMPGAGEMELPPEEFGDLILPTWKKDSSNLHEVGFDVEVIGGQGLTTVSSPSHGIMAAGEGSERRVGMAVEADVPNRDLVLEAKAADPWQIAWASEGTISALLGSSRFGEPDEDSPRRVVFVIDRSGSMHGKPFEQALKAVEVGIAALRPDDHFSIVAFDNEIEALSKRLLEANDRNRQVARDFLAGLHTCGGTELAIGVRAGAKALGRDGGDLLLLTDGQVFGTAKILKTARKAKARIHALGIGSASQDRFLAQLGRETGGQSRFLTSRERVDMALLDLFAGISPAVATDVEVRLDGKTLTTADVHVGRPLLVTGEGSGPELEIGWAEGGFALPVVEAPKRLGKTLRLLDGAAKITEVESRISGDPVGEDAGVLESLSREYGLASRVMALVAVVKREADKPGELPMTKVVPVGMPQDVEMDAYFDQGVYGLGSAESVGSALGQGEILGALIESRRQAIDASPARATREDEPFYRKVLGLGRRPDEDFDVPTVAWEDVLMEDASRLEADGGMPGDSLAERIAASLDLLERLVDHGSTRTKGAFRHHVRRLLDFLGEADLDEEQRNRLEELEARVERVFHLP
ncbi:MAG: VIT domain-containing protein [Thermoanaerobaculia bacterium]